MNRREFSTTITGLDFSGIKEGDMMRVNDPLESFGFYAQLNRIVFRIRKYVCPDHEDNQWHFDLGWDALFKITSIYSSTVLNVSKSSPYDNS